MRKFAAVLLMMGMVLGTIAPAEAARKLKVGVTIKPAIVMVGQEVTVSGVVSPKVRGTRVVLQRRLVGTSTWKRDTTTRVRHDGTFKLRDKPSAVGGHQYRVKVAKSRGYRAGISKAVRLRVESADPNAWVMTPNSFGPITTSTTVKQALSTGAFIRAAAPCENRRLNWKRIPEDAAMDMSVPSLEIYNDRAEYIDAGSLTRTDRGFGIGTSVGELQAGYGKRLLSGSYNGVDSGLFAVDGRKSSLIFHTEQGYVANFYVARGLMTPDSMVGGRGGLC